MFHVKHPKNPRSAPLRSRNPYRRLQNRAVRDGRRLAPGDRDSKPGPLPGVEIMIFPVPESTSAARRSSRRFASGHGRRFSDARPRAAIRPKAFGCSGHPNAAEANRDAPLAERQIHKRRGSIEAAIRRVALFHVKHPETSASASPGRRGNVEAPRRARSPQLNCPSGEIFAANPVKSMAADRAADFSGPVSTSMSTRHIATEAAESTPKIRPRDGYFSERRRKNRHSAEARQSPGG